MKTKSKKYYVIYDWYHYDWYHPIQGMMCKGHEEFDSISNTKKWIKQNAGLYDNIIGPLIVLD